MRPHAEPSRAVLLAAEVLGSAPAREALEALRREPILLALAPELAATRRGQLMFATVASLLGRLFDFVGTLDLAEDTHARTLSPLPGLRRGSRLADRTASFLRGLRPPEVAELDVRPVARRALYPRAIVIGPLEDVPARDVVWVDGDRWLARVGGTPPVRTPRSPRPRALFNPLGPLVAAAWGVAELSKRFFHELSGPDAARRFPPLETLHPWNLWSHSLDEEALAPLLLEPVRFGEVALAGLGALGSAAVYALAQLPGHCQRIELVDDDALSPSNLERVLTAGARDLGRRKIDLARRELGGGWTRVAGIPGRYGAGLPPRARAGTLLVGVDSGAARRRITRHLPYAVYNGGTQASELLVSRHVAFGGACLECLYPDVAGSDAARACGRTEPEEELPAATIGFVSALCGFLMVGELVKDRLVPERAEPLDEARPVFRLDALAGTPGPECVEAYVPRRGCFCRSPEVREAVAARRGG